VKNFAETKKRFQSLEKSSKSICYEILAVVELIQKNIQQTTKDSEIEGLHNQKEKGKDTTKR